jgi:hypothetical protein
VIDLTVLKLKSSKSLRCHPRRSLRRGSTPPHSLLLGRLELWAFEHQRVEAEKGDLPALSVANLARYMTYIPSLGFLPAALASHPFEHQRVEAEKGDLPPWISRLL